MLFNSTYPTMNMSEVVQRRTETRTSHYEDAGFLFDIVRCYPFISKVFTSLLSSMDACQPP